MKILFSGKLDDKSGYHNTTEKIPLSGNKKGFKLERSEIVALFNALGR